MPTVASETLHALIRAVCTATGSVGQEPALVADQLVEANLTGHDSHGVGLIPYYVECRAKGALVANRHAELVSGRGPVLVVEGQRGYGQVIGQEAMQLAMARAAEQGVALLAIRNSFHLGRIGHWAERCAERGFASIHFVNGIDHRPLQAIYASAEARLSTNPFCAALPGPDGAMVLLDMATSKIALGKARVAANRGVPAPDDSLLDHHGEPTRDPWVIFREPIGALVAMGEHKGSGLAVLCEFLAGALTGGSTVQPEHPMAGGTINNMLSVVIDPEALGGRERLWREGAALATYLKSARPRAGFAEVLLPGEPELRRRRERRAAGIEIDERSWADILDAVKAAGVADRAIAALRA
jgi:uncharacterized oxidoreductase